MDPINIIGICFGGGLLQFGLAFLVSKLPQLSPDDKTPCRAREKLFRK